jgi:aspartate aminotransferase
VRRTVIANSWSKAMAMAGERIGYLAISPGLEEDEALRNACTFTNRILGYINAPAIWQWVVAETQDATIDVALYQRKRDVVCDALEGFGYSLIRPAGTFYVFPQSPVPDDMAFVNRLLEEGILAVPGAGFGRPGHFRLSLTIPMEAIERSLPGFGRAAMAARAAGA